MVSKVSNKNCLRWIPQLDKYGCTVACVAMATGVSYPEAYQWLLPHTEPETFQGLRIWSLGQKLIDLGFEVNPLIWPGDFIALKFPTILATKEETDEYHAVLWDSQAQRVLDPERKKSLPTQNYQARSFLGLELVDIPDL